MSAVGCVPVADLPSTSPLFWSVGQLQAAYRQRLLSPLEVVDEALTRIDRFNGELQAFLGRTDELAREQARAAEAAWRAGTAAPLSGIPVSIKDTFHIAGHVASYGSLAYRDNLRAADSGVTRRLRQAGAVFCGRTNTSEFAQSATAENRFVDDTRNPWDLGRTAGGSSGGAAASVAAGLATMAVGADGGGSIRIPAAFTGVFGFKPSYGLCSDEGGLNAMSDFISPGPFARSVADARLMLSVLADTEFIRQELPADLRLGLCLQPDGCPHDAGLLATVEAAARHFETLGYQLTSFDLELAGWQPAFNPLVLSNEHRERGKLLLEQVELLTGYERRSLEYGAQLSEAQVRTAQREHELYRSRIEKLFEHFDIILLPTTAVPAFPVAQRPDCIDGQDVHWLWGAFPCTAPFNVAGNPAASIPCGLVQGLPVGLQLVAPMWADALLLDVAERLEHELGFTYEAMHAQWPGRLA